MDEDVLPLWPKAPLGLIVKESGPSGFTLLEPIKAP